MPINAGISIAYENSQNVSFEQIFNVKLFIYYFTLRRIFFYIIQMKETVLSKYKNVSIAWDMVFDKVSEKQNRS